MKRTGKLLLILQGICAVSCALKMILGIIHQAYLTSTFSFVIDVLCAILWSICFALELKSCHAEEA